MAEGLTTTVTGLGVLGDVEPGWSAQEFATPVNPNERAGGTGVFSYAAKDVAAGILAINKDAVSTYEPMGSVAGVVRTSSKTGQRITVTHDNKLARYNATRLMPPMIAASVPGALDLAEQVLGSPGFNGTSGSYWSLFGHGAGYDAEGNPVEQTTTLHNWEMYDNITGEFERFTETTYGNLLGISNINTLTGLETEYFQIIGGRHYASNLSGGSFNLAVEPGTYNTATESPLTKLRIMGKTMLNGENMQFALTGQPSGPADSDFEQVLGIQLDYAAGDVEIFADARSGGIPSSFSTSFSIASLDLDAELAFRIYYTDAALTTAGPPVRYQLAFSICNTSDYSTVVEGVLGFTPDNQPIYFTPWTITGHVRALWERTDLGGLTNIPSWPLAERQDWETTRNYDYLTSITTVGEPSIGFSGAVWDWLQEVCSAYRWEVGLDGDVVTARPIGQVELDISNYAPIPTLTPTTTRTGRQVDIVYQNPTIVSNGEIYNALDDDNRIISVGAAQETVTKISSGAYLTSISQPSRAVTVTPSAGEYVVIDSTGLPIVEGQWEDFGGALSVAIDSADAGTIDVTLTGPREEIPSTTAPYSLALSDGTNQYAALSIVGSGVVANPETLNLLTGANPDITPQEVAFTVTNSFISTVEQAYDSGIWAAVDASGPRIELTISVPTSALTGFGVTAGSLINIEDSTYRVISASVGRTATSITAVRHATVDAFDVAWNSETVGDHDTAWDGYLCEDQRVLTYLGSPAATLPPPVFPP